MAHLNFNLYHQSITFKRIDIAEYADSIGKSRPATEAEWKYVETMVSNGINEYIWDIIQTALEENELDREY